MPGRSAGALLDRPSHRSDRRGNPGRTRRRFDRAHARTAPDVALRRGGRPPLVAGADVRARSSPRWRRAHRQLELTSTATERAHALLVSETRRIDDGGRAPSSAPASAEAGLPSSGEQTGHLLMLAELRGLICSGPMPRHDAHLRLGRRCRATLTHPRPTGRGARAHAAVLHRPRSGERERPAPMDDVDADRDPIGAHRTGGGRIVDRADRRRIDVVVRARRAPTTPGRTTGVPPARVRRAVPELSIDQLPRAEGHPRGDRPHSFAEAGGGVVVCDRHDVGWWKRKEVAGGRVVVTMGLATSLGAEEQALIVESAARLGSFTGRTVDIVHS